MIAELRLFSEAIGLGPEEFPYQGLVPSDIASPTSHAPFEISASSYANEGWKPFQAFDADPLTGWACIGLPSWLQIDLGSSQPAGSYSIQFAAAGQDVSYAPQAWTIQGSIDGISWAILDTRGSEGGWTANQDRTYSIGTLSSNRYYRLCITSNNGGYYTMLARFSLFPQVVHGITPQVITFLPFPDSKTTDIVTFTASSDSGLPVSVVVTSGPASLAGGRIVPSGPGAVTLTATQSGNAVYAATAVVQSFIFSDDPEISPHDLTSYTSHAPFVVSASSERHTGYNYDAWRAFDG